MLNVSDPTVGKKVEKVQQAILSNPEWQQKLMSAKDEEEFLGFVVELSEYELTLEDISATLQSRKLNLQSDFDLAEEQLIAVADRAPQRSGNTGSCGTSNCPTGGSTHGCKS